MISYKDEDKVFNKSIVVYRHELEDSDTIQIKKEISKVAKQFDYDDEITIDLCSDLTGDNVEFDVIISDYLTKEEYEKL